MAEQVVAQEVKPEQQVAQPEVKVEVTTQPEKKVDLVTRVSQVKTPATPTPQVEDKFNINELDSAIESLGDPKLKEQVLGLKKSLISGENQKYQEIAKLRKDYENKLAEVSNWTPERIKQEMNKPDFIQSAQTILNAQQAGISDEKWSTLSEAEKAEITQLKQKINLLEQSSHNAARSQQDVVLTQKYANYDPKIVDQLFSDLQSNRIQATVEDLWKVYDYEDAVKRAYQLGLEDKQVINQEKVIGMTPSLGVNMSRPTALERQPGESVQSFMLRSYNSHSQKK